MKLPPLHDGEEGVPRHREMYTNFLSKDSTHEFILKDDPLVPIKPCSRCNHNKGFITYTYKQYQPNDSRRLSHFGMIRCDRCGAPQTWIPKKGRELLCKKHNIDTSQ